MRSLFLNLSLITCVALYAGDAFARIKMESFNAEIKSNCLEEDGASLSIKVTLPSGVFTGHVYGRGVADLSLGKVVTMDGNTKDSTGKAEFCETGKECRPIRATISFPALLLGTLAMSMDGQSEVQFPVTASVTKSGEGCD